MLATQLCHRQTCLALFQYCHDLAFGKPAFLQGSLHIREAPKFYRLTSTHRGSLRELCAYKLVQGPRKKTTSTIQCNRCRMVHLPDVQNRATEGCAVANSPLLS